MAIAIADPDGGKPLCVELGLSAKGARRLAEIVRAYVRARHVAGVRYYVTPRSERQVREAIAATRDQGLVELRRLEDRTGAAA